MIWRVAAVRQIEEIARHEFRIPAENWEKVRIDLTIDHIELCTLALLLAVIVAIPTTLIVTERSSVRFLFWRCLARFTPFPVFWRCWPS